MLACLSLYGRLWTAQYTKCLQNWEALVTFFKANAAVKPTSFPHLNHL